jgi:hypothetical protein
VHVIAHQRITDPAGYRAMAERPTPGRPPHWRLITSVPTRDGSACFSLWWADSAEALECYLRNAVGAAGHVECHEVDEDSAVGLAETPLTVIRVARRG